MDRKNSHNSSANAGTTSDNDKAALPCIQSAYIEDAAKEGENEFEINLLDDGYEHANLGDAGNPQRNQGANLNNQLEEFRQQWQDELHNCPGSGRGSPRLSRGERSEERQKNTQRESDLEDEARNFFFQGMQAEDDGALTEAIYYYKKALQLVPDIESKLGNVFNQSPRDRDRQESVSSVDESDIEEDLLLHIENIRIDDESLCQPLYEQRMTHISELPVELVTYILQWVVSNDLDLQSLEMFSAVCRGFFTCARDERLWKMACSRIWGINLGSAKKYGGSWRRMMIERPHLLFSGCYISRTSYIRQGEQSLDQFYRPYHLVEYYRYARFFPDGVVLMLVSAEDPLQSLPNLRYRNAKFPELLRGGYKMSENKVTCVMKRIKFEPTQTFRYKRQRQAAVKNDSEITYYVEFELANPKNKQNVQLSWVKYSVTTLYKATGAENISNFELNKRTFPPLMYSPVKSYIGSSTEPLMLTV